MLIMFCPKNQAIGLLLIILAISGFHYEVSGARWLSENYEKVEDNSVNAQVLMNSFNSTGDGGFFATSNRQVPSAPDPLHNR
ncbi:hypothetical protein RchiOBHm_Chr3g0454611 [Rosa chinensis]|uniref:Uncharacterized protein n=1 Tax=Rosa chinensis TaxID=74649 RepID=A0A2P6R6W3_ROSCH|nr:hypothetical protein RchiOBHm_Chr3g0454611 [Rosa chinensis]